MQVPVPHPAVEVLARRRITRRYIAAELGVSPFWVGQQLNGYAQPSGPFRRGLAKILGLPEHELFVEPSDARILEVRR